MQGYKRRPEENNQASQLPVAIFDHVAARQCFCKYSPCEQKCSATRLSVQCYECALKALCGSRSRQCDKKRLALIQNLSTDSTLAAWAMYVPSWVIEERRIESALMRALWLCHTHPHTHARAHSASSTKATRMRVIWSMRCVTHTHTHTRLLGL